MPALGFGLAADREDDRCRERKKKTEHRRRRRARAASPDSGTTSAAAGGLLVTSTSGLSSLGSDIDAFFSQLTFSRVLNRGDRFQLAQHLAGREGSRSDPDQEKRDSFPHSDTLPRPLDRNHSSKLKAFTEPEEDDKDEETLDPASHSFSFALRECQNRRFRSEALSLSLPGRKPRRRRPISLDLNGPGPPGVDVTILSPRFFMSGAGGVKKSSTAASSRNRSGVFPSPGTPSYRNGGGAMAYQKGWSSERVPLPANSSRRYMGGGALLPFNNGRALPSKWEDAEKWICSPMSGDGRPSLPPTHHRRPKSKSGPLGAPDGSYSAASPLVPCFDSGRVGNFMAGSPFLAGVLVADRGGSGSYSSAGSGGRGCGDGGRRSSSANAEPYIMRSASIHGWSDALIESSSSLPSSQDENVDSIREAAIIISPVLRKDVATQMSPDGSTQSSPKDRPSFSPSPSAQPIEELESHFSKMEIRDVQVDDRVTVTRWSKKHTNRGFDKRSTNIIEWKKKSVEAKASGWDVAETTKCIAKYKREEAKITAWENLQKAKAEAEIRKLEMKLEKKRSSSMDKILNKLRSAQRKAQEMRSAATASQSHEVARTTKRISYFRRTGQISSLSGCFTCHAF